jgi:hypothetical protein
MLGGTPRQILSIVFLHLLADSQVLPYGYADDTRDNVGFDEQSGEFSPGTDFARECCLPGQFSMYFHKHNVVGDHTVKLIETYNRVCDCKGLLWMNTGVHMLLGTCGDCNTNALLEVGDNNREPWMFPFGRPAALRPILRAAKNATNLKVVFSSTPRLSMEPFMLAPPKYDWAQFRQFDTLDLWAEYDKLLAIEMGVVYAPYFEASRAYKGLQCDGLHFSPRSYDDVCKGYTVLTDLVVHQALAQVCYGVNAAITARGDNPREGNGRSV